MGNVITNGKMTLKRFCKSIQKNKIGKFSALISTRDQFECVCLINGEPELIMQTDVDSKEQAGNLLVLIISEIFNIIPDDSLHLEC